MRRINPKEYDAPSTHRPLRRMRRIRQGVIGGVRAHTESFEYRLTDVPGWLVMIGRPGMDLAAARRRIEYQFGADRVVEVRALHSNAVFTNSHHSTQQHEATS